MNPLGVKIRALREPKGKLFRQFGVYLEIDPALISKGERQLKIMSKE